VKVLKSLGLSAITAVSTIWGTAIANSTTYIVDQSIGSGSVVGFIQTDGATGVLGAGDIDGWNLNLTGAGGASFNLQPGNSAVQVVGIDLTATKMDLYFDFDGSDNGYLLFQDGLFSGQFYTCDQAGAGYPGSGPCLQGASVAPVSYGDPSFQSVAVTGNQIIGVAAAPLPAALPLFATGLGAMGLFGWRKKRRSQAIAA
jgi:hypothetical protein